MTLQALIATADRVFSLERFPLPALKPTEVLVRTLYSGVSVGTEFMVFQGRLDWGPFPVCTGYQATGEVIGVGSAVDRFREGDVVYYRSNFAPLILNGTEVNRCSATHADFAVVPQDAEMELLPDGVDPAVGSMFVMPSVGWNAVDMAGIQMDELVAMQGLGLIGTGAMLAARLRGARVVGIELDERRMQLARALGIDHVIDARTEDVEAALEAIQPGGADVAFEATGLPQNLDSAFRLARRHGRFVYLGNLGALLYPSTSRYRTPRC